MTSRPISRTSTNLTLMTQPFLYSVEREFPVSIEKLWKAWANASDLEAWYHGTAHRSVKGSTESELVSGGLWSCGVYVPSHDFSVYFYGRYTKIIQHEIIEHTMHYTDSADEFKLKDFNTASHDVVISFESRGEKSWVKFSQYGELPEGEEKQAQAGMESYFDSLGNFLIE